jgi:carboxyl-terminal processing protease
MVFCEHGVMKKTVMYGALVCALTLNVIVGAHIYRVHAQGREEDDPERNYKLFVNVLERVRNEYVEGSDLTYQDLIYGALKGMLDTLDPHSEFMDVDKYTELKKDTEGVFGGVGLVIGVREDALTVVSPMDGTPAARAGILPGDRIVTIDGTSTARLGIQEAVKLLRGEPGTEVTMTISTPSSGTTRDVVLERAIIKVETVKDINGGQDFPLGEGGVGYIRLTQFGEQTSSELDAALRSLSKQGMESLILDLRGNPGGLLEQAVKVCEKFLPRRQLIVSTEGRRATDRAEYRASGNGRYANLPLAILVNGGSASASEIVAGCLQDTTAAGKSRALVLGEQTFGKGSVQKILPLEGGLALRLTTAKYYTPSHKVIHEHGITPDRVIPMTDKQQEALLVRFRGSMEGLSPEDRQLLDENPDVQLERAKAVLRGVTIYTRQFEENQRQEPLPDAGKVARAE